MPAIGGFGATRGRPRPGARREHRRRRSGCQCLPQRGLAGHRVLRLRRASQLYAAASPGSDRADRRRWPARFGRVAEENGPVSCLTRQADAGATSKVYAVSPGRRPARLLPVAFDRQRGRRIRCVGAPSARPRPVSATLNNGQAKVFYHDPAATTGVPPRPERAHGRRLARCRRVRRAPTATASRSCTNFDARAATLIETTPDASHFSSPIDCGGAGGLRLPGPSVVRHRQRGAESDRGSCFGSNATGIQVLAAASATPADPLALDRPIDEFSHRRACAMTEPHAAQHAKARPSPTSTSASAATASGRR